MVFIFSKLSEAVGWSASKPESVQISFASCGEKPVREVYTAFPMDKGFFAIISVK